jgi:predicted amidohydrolase
MHEVSFSTPYRAAVVQPALLTVRDDATARASQDENARRVAEQIGAIMSFLTPRPRLVVWPVLCLTSANRGRLGVRMTTIASSLDDARWEPIRAACREFDCYFASTLQEAVPEMPGRFFHTGFVLGPEGLELRSPKAQAYSAPEVTALRDIHDEYEAAFGKGSVQPVVATPIGRLGCLVESELLVPETVRVLASKGAEVIIHPSAEHEGGPPYAPFRQAIAHANGVYVISAVSGPAEANPGAADWAPSAGNSMIVGPEGVIDVELGERAEGFAAATIDPARIAAAREEQSRTTEPAPNLYRGLYA